MWPSDGYCSIIRDNVFTRILSKTAGALLRSTRCLIRAYAWAVQLVRAMSGQGNHNDK